MRTTAARKSGNGVSRSGGRLPRAGIALDQVAATQRMLEEAKRLNSELAEKAAQLAQISRHKSEFLERMSHDLRTPLNSLLVLAKILADGEAGPLTPAQARHAQTIFASGSRLLTFVNEILDLSTLEAGKLHVHVGPLEIADLQAYVESTFGQLAQQKGLELVVHIGPGTPATLLTDAQHVRRILQNLLANAFKFTERGRVALVVEPAPEGVSLAVTDSGIGIPELKQQLVFEAFQQADASIARRYGGNGLGLTISRDLARLLGGEILLRSAPGVGSTFTLLLPLQAPAERASAAPRTRPAPPPLPRDASAAPDGLPPFAGAKVLLVDDDARTLFSVTSLLENHGADVVCADSAAEGLQALSANPDLDLVLLDTVMPEVDGVEAARRMRGVTPPGGIPIVAIAAAAAPGDRERCLEAGCDDFVARPVDDDTLLGVVRRWLHK